MPLRCICGVPDHAVNNPQESHRRTFGFDDAALPPFWRSPRRLCAGLWCVYALYMLLSVFSSLLCAVILSLFQISATHTPLSILLLSTVPAYFGALPLCCLVLLRRFPAVRPPRQTLVRFHVLKWCVISVFLLETGARIGNSIEALLRQILGMQLTNKAEQMLADVPIRWIFLCTVVLAPLTEELLFRKLLLDRLYFMNGAVAVFASGFSFGLIHGNFSQFFYAFFLGCLLAVLYRRTGRLSYCVGLHAFVNCIGAFIPLLLRSMIQEPARSLLAGNAPLKSFHLLTSWQRFFVLLQVLFSGLQWIGIAAGLVFCMIALVRKRNRLLHSFSITDAGILFGNIGFILFALLCAASFAFSFLS